MCQRDDKRGFRAMRRRHVARDPALIAVVEHALDEEDAIGAELCSMLAQRVDEFLVELTRFSGHLNTGDDSPARGGLHAEESRAIPGGVPDGGGSADPFRAA
jgi:hypothetical protein